jgi:hypothetical protein
MPCLQGRKRGARKNGGEEVQEQRERRQEEQEQLTFTAFSSRHKRHGVRTLSCALQTDLVNGLQNDLVNGAYNVQPNELAYGAPNLYPSIGVTHRQPRPGRRLPTVCSLEQSVPYGRIDTVALGEVRLLDLWRVAMRERRMPLSRTVTRESPIVTRRRPPSSLRPAAPSPGTTLPPEAKVEVRIMCRYT